MIQLYDILSVTTEDILKLVERLSATEFIFDGVKYHCKDLEYCLSRGLLRKLLTTSKVLSGTPSSNDKSYLFIYKIDGRTSSIITTNKYWNAEKTVAVYTRNRFDLLVIQKRFKEEKYATFR